eukprot:1149188-Pelagomonas_calceolata.AAC.3
MGLGSRKAFTMSCEISVTHTSNLGAHITMPKAQGRLLSSAQFTQSRKVDYNRKGLGNNSSKQWQGAAHRGAPTFCALQSCTCAYNPGIWDQTTGASSANA